MTKEELEQLKDKLDQQSDRLKLVLAEIKYTHTIVTGKLINNQVYVLLCWLQSF